MNWDAIGAIAELLGAIGVIASLVYLATQIRQSREQMSQNTRALRVSSYQRHREEAVGTFHIATTDRTLLGVIRKGIASFDDLDEADAHQFMFWAAGAMYSFENAHYLFRTGMLDADRWELQRASLREFFANPGYVEWWRATPLPLGPEFIALVDEILTESATATSELAPSESQASG